MKYRKGKLFFLPIVTLIFFPVLLFGQFIQDFDEGLHGGDFERIAQSGWQFLKLPTTARSAAMGGIITATGNGDASAALTNPASTADVEGYDVSFTRMDWIADIAYQSGSIVKNFGGLGFIGINFVYLDYGDMVRTENQEIFRSDGSRTGLSEIVTDLGMVTASDFAMGLSYATRITDRLKVGGTFRYIQEKLDDATTSNVSFDVGTIYETGLKTFRLSMVGRNFGRDAEFVQWDERIGIPAMKVRMPMSLNLGGAIDLLEGGPGNPHLLTVAAELVHPNDGPEKINVGTEYTFSDLLSLRGGYRFNYDEEGITLGGGLNVEVSQGTNVQINYSYWDFGILGSVNMFSVGFGF
jgi:hypothetical protein